MIHNTHTVSTVALLLITLISPWSNSDEIGRSNQTISANSQKQAVNHLSQKQLLKKISHKTSNTVIIDVRTPSEYQRGHLPSAINIPHEKILKNKSLLDPYTNSDMVFYCHSGDRVKKVTDFLLSEKYTNLYHLQGDYRAWRGNNQKVEK